MKGSRLLDKVAFLINLCISMQLQRTFYQKQQRGVVEEKNTNGVSEPSASAALLDREAY